MKILNHTDSKGRQLLVIIADEKASIGMMGAKDTVNGWRVGVATDGDFLSVSVIAYQNEVYSSLERCWCNESTPYTSN